MRYFWKRGNIRKTIPWNRRLRYLCTLCFKVSKKFHLHFNLWLTKILQNGAKFIQKSTPSFKNHMKNFNNFRQAVERRKSWNSRWYFCTFLRLKHYIQSIHLTLLSTACKKIHQIPYVIFETISHLSRRNSSVFFKLKIYSTKLANENASFQTFHCLH